ncbi:phage tail tape measure protein [Pseudomonas aeruginosa]|uniref:phage tail tape measure protein n=1 Tax=Pseudomonas aeruginosa TaxID=287 RepID=UPI001B3963AF|nr:phage tail tape measure protein [Pseudomonas aeruginosa]MBQ0240666.1 phage tail tape measure protein [Pseudomonas aeruginosa]MBQ0295929.1 phage tail tape measure protein [Pseudomonas aeruginosa]MBT0641010.1 phage tail tape measure protein [Pseudomonas aeruginosa]MBV7719958.1 phage tail tape measure protein [Pseudomonas aeruginosa]MBX7441790.1 phage tail tape measure protein [Pseudomonas aeruginosa]
MAEESRLSIIIDSRGAEKNATSLSDALDRVERSGDEAAGSTSRLSEVTVRLGSNMSKAAAATVASLSRIERATESTSSQMTALVSRAVALENAMSSVGQGIGRLDTGITQSNAQLGQLNTQMSHLVSTFSTFSQGQSAINAQLSRIAANMSRAADEAQGLDQATEKVSRTTRSTEKSIEEERAGLAKLLGQINPTVAALDRLDDMQAKLQRYKKLGIVESDTLVEYSKRLETLRQDIGRTSESMGRLGVSSGQTANAIRMLPAQLTDVFTQLAGGQSLMMVLIQQGGQIKDSFGGLGNMFATLEDSISNLFRRRPLQDAAEDSQALTESLSDSVEQSKNLKEGLDGAKSVVASSSWSGATVLAVGALTAAIAGLAYAYYDAYSSEQEFTKALYAGNGTIGLTVTQLQQLASETAAVTGSYGEAEDAFKALAAQSNLSATQLKNFGSAAAAMAQYTNANVVDLAKGFADLGTNATTAAQKASQQFGLVSAAQYDVIRALDAQGEHQRALDVLSEELNRNALSRMDQYQAAQSDIEQGWDNIKSAISEAYAAVKSELFPNAAKQIEIIQRQIDYVNAYPVLSAFTYAGGGSREEVLAGLEAQKKALQDNLTQQEANAKNQADLSKAEQEYISVTKALDDQLANVSPASRRADAVKKLNEQFLKLMETSEKTGNKNPLLAGVEYDGRSFSGGAYDRLLKGINDKIKDPRTPKTRGQNAGVREADNTASRLLAQYDPAGQAVRTLTKEETQLQLALSRGKITREEYSKALAQASLNYAAAIKGAQGLTAAEQYQAQLERQLLLQREQYAAQAAAVGMGGLEAERYQQRIQLEQQSNDRVLQLQTELAQATTEKQRQELQAQIDLEREYLPKRIQAQKEGYQQMDKARQDWLDGAASGARTWFEQIDDTASQTRSAMMRGLDGLNDELHTFVTTGKASFRSLTTSVLSDLARIAQNKFITSLISSMSGSSNGVISAIGSYFTANAKGGVYSSPSLSAFSNGVYNSPQFFAFAKGAGVFGEAGPEAIMPLTRAADGSLGVRAIGSGGAKSAGGNTFQINTNVTVTAGTTSQSVTSDTNDNYAMQLSKMIADVARGVIAQESQPGGIIWRMQNGR